MNLTDRDLYRCFDAILAAGAVVPDADLSPEERKPLSGHCLPEGPSLVYAVAAALRDDPELFADVRARVDPDDLVARFERGRAFFRLAGLLRHLGRCAMDAYLLDTSGAVRDALSVIEQSRATSRLPVPPPDHAQRRDRLRLAERALAPRIASGRRGGRKGRPSAS